MHKCKYEIEQEAILKMKQNDVLKFAQHYYKEATLDQVLESESLKQLIWTAMLMETSDDRKGLIAPSDFALLTEELKK